MGNGNRPTPELRREAVRLALMSGRTRREVAEDLSIGLGRSAHAATRRRKPTALARCFVAPGP